MPTSPFAHEATTGFPSMSVAVARPFSQSMTALTEAMSETAPSSEQPGRPGRAGHVHVHDRVPAGHEVVVVVERELERLAVRVVRLPLALVAPAAAQVVGAGVHDHRHGVHAVQLAGPDDVGGH